MGISVVSSASANLGRTASATTSGTTEGLPGDFAALLSGQNLAAALTPSIDAVATSGSRPAGTDDDGLTAEGITLDPAILAAMMGAPPLPPAPPSGQALAASDGKNPESDDLLASLGGSNASMPDALAASLTAKGNASSVLGAETDRQLANLANEAANVAADPSASADANTNFEMAMAGARLQQEKSGPEASAISTPLTSANWSSHFSEKVVWLARNDHQSAQININPPQLGPLQITLNLNGDQANAVFASPHAEVRQAIEAALPQLREMLATAGINLGDANVGANLARQNPDNPFPSSNKNQSGHETAILPASEGTASTAVGQALHRGRGMVDLFA